MPSTILHHATPILKVKDLEASMAYYTGSLGFKVDWQFGNFGSVSRDICKLFLTEDTQGHPGTWLWIAVSDTEVLFAEWSASGAKIRQGPTNFPWGSLEVQVTDLDGHVLRFASDGKEGAPFGPWMDADGNLWPMDTPNTTTNLSS